jgi:hypothetical protein
LAALHPERTYFADVFAQHRHALDWDVLIERAAAHKVDALLASRVDVSDVAADVPSDARDRLRAALGRAADRHAKATQSLAVIDACLRRHGIEYVLIKGPVLTEQLYDDPAQRHFFDLDLIVRGRDVDGAQAALEELGYRLWGGAKYLGFAPDDPADLARATRLMRSALARCAHELSFVDPEGRWLPIDLHWNLMPPARIGSRSAVELWEHLATASVGGVTVTVLDSESMLLQLAMHAWSNRPWTFVLLHLCDVAWAVQRLPIDAQRLAMRADRWKGRGDLARALSAVESLFGVTSPGALRMVQDASPPTGLFRRITSAENLIERHAQPAPRGVARYRRDLVWGVAMRSIRSTAIWEAGRYATRLRYRLGL